MASNLKYSILLIESSRLTHFADHIGGHILGSTHVPSQTLDYKMPELVRKLKDKDTGVFHCALSQQRGPGAALRYMRERERLLGAAPRVDGAKWEKEGSKLGNRQGEIGNEEKEEDGKGDGNRNDGGNSENVNEQEVYVLDRGFVGWQERFGEDERLTEGYRKELWKDGYWM